MLMKMWFYNLCGEIIVSDVDLINYVSVGVM